MSISRVDDAVNYISSGFNPLETYNFTSSHGPGPSGAYTYPGFFDVAGGYLDRLNDIAAANSAASAAQAAELRSWQEKQNRIAMDFNSREAAKNRDWQQMMSNTAHQREVADLIAAGLNPVLSATGGNGAAVTSGATASGVTSAGAKGDVDMSANQSIASLLGTMLTAQTNLMNTITTAQNNMAIAEKNNAMSKLIAEMNNSNQFNIAKIYESLGMFQSLNSLAGTQLSANRSYEATALAALYSLFGTQYMADMNYKIQQDFPNTWPAFVERFLEGLGFGPHESGVNFRDFLVHFFRNDGSDKVSNAANTVANAAGNVVMPFLPAFASGFAPSGGTTTNSSGYSGTSGSAKKDYQRFQKWNWNLSKKLPWNDTWYSNTYNWSVTRHRK